MMNTVHSFRHPTNRVPDWQRDAPCAGELEIFAYRLAGERDTAKLKRYRLAHQLCTGCPLLASCALMAQQQPPHEMVQADIVWPPQENGMGGPRPLADVLAAGAVPKRRRGRAA